MKIVFFLTMLPGNNLSYKSIEVGVSWSRDVQFFSADVINCFVVNHECHFRVF